MGLTYDLCQKDVNLCVPTLLKASFLYYIQDKESPISDHEFDSICRLALENWPQINHKLKHLITEDDLRSGSLYSIPAYKYPEGFKRLAMHWVKLGTKDFHRQRWSI